VWMTLGCLTKCVLSSLDHVSTLASAHPDVGCLEAEHSAASRHRLDDSDTQDQPRINTGYILHGTAAHRMFPHTDLADEGK
ncbi:hypothetical protein R3P38DRAFT_3146951, partial [Favolaschia claudopus]